MRGGGDEEEGDVVGWSRCGSESVTKARVCTREGQGRDEGEGEGAVPCCPVPAGGWETHVFVREEEGPGEGKARRGRDQEATEAARALLTAVVEARRVARPPGPDHSVRDACRLRTNRRGCRGARAKIGAEYSIADGPTAQCSAPEQQRRAGCKEMR